MPEAVLRRPSELDVSSGGVEGLLELDSTGPGVAALLTSYELKEKSSSSSSCGSRKLAEGFEGLSVSCDGEGDNRLDRQNPRE
jgi:hypothetical protein